MKVLKFSVVLPVYKTEEEILLRAINSVRAQSCQEWELLVVDDNHKGSRFKEITEAAAKANSDSRVKYFIQDDNHGANAARNKGVSESTGEWVTFVDADDEWMSDYLAQLEDIILVNGDVDLISSGYRVITQSRSVNICRELPKGNYHEQELYEDLVSPTSAVAVRTSVLRSVSGFDEALPARQDYDTWLRISKDHDFYFNSSVCVNVYRNGHESISTNYMNHVNGTLMVLEKIKKHDLSPEQLEKISAGHYLRIAEYCVAFGDYQLAKEYLKKCSFSTKKLKYSVICAMPRLYGFVRNTARSAMRALKNKA